MKNIHKIRGKREFLFDDRELIVLGSGAVVICLLIFVLGFLIGQGVQDQAMASSLPAEEPLGASELASAQPVDTEKQPIGEITQTGTGDKKKPQSAYYRVLPDKGEYVQVEATPVKAAAAEPVSTPEPSAKEAKVETPNPSDVKQEPVPQTQPVAAATPVTPRQNTAGVPAALPNVPKTPMDDMRVGRPAAQSGATTVPSGPGFSVQVASSPSQQDSERLQQKFAGLGFDVYIKQVDLNAKGLWYRVYIGNTATKEEAEQLRREIVDRASHLTKDPYIVKNPN